MVLAILPALIPDVDAVYDAYFAAFKADKDGKAILDIIFPDGFESAEFRKAHTAGTIQWWHTSKSQYTVKCLDTITSEVIGMALFDVFHQVPEGSKEFDERHRFPGIPWLEGERLERAEKVLSPLWDARGCVWGGKAYIYLHAVAVDPKHQGRGAGAALLRDLINKGDTGNVPIYLESTPKSEGLYRKLGFVRVPRDVASVVHRKEVIGGDEDVEVPLMVKMPSGARP